MSFSLRLGKSPLDRRARIAEGGEAEPERSKTPAFGRGLLIGFCGAFFLFDLALMGGATTRGYFYALQHLLTGR